MHLFLARKFCKICKQALFILCTVPVLSLGLKYPFRCMAQCSAIRGSFNENVGGEKKFHKFNIDSLRLFFIL